MRLAIFCQDMIHRHAFTINHLLFMAREKTIGFVLCIGITMLMIHHPFPLSIGKYRSIGKVLLGIVF